MVATHLARADKKHDKFRVGDLVMTRDRSLVYMLVQRGNTLPLRTGRGTLSGVCVWSRGGKDRDGDALPEPGFFHDNLGEQGLTLCKDKVTMENDHE